MTQNAEWHRLMDAPWGSRTPQAMEAKRIAMVRYDEDTKAFWARRNMPVPTFQGEVKAEPTPIESWVPRLAPAFAEMANDRRALDADGISRLDGWVEDHLHLR